jgi:hypothetical protein
MAAPIDENLMISRLGKDALCAMRALVLVMPLAALAGWSLGMPLAIAADRLLASAMPESISTREEGGPPVPASLDARWRRALQVSLALGAIAIAWRTASTATHSVPDALLLALGVATLALVGVLDGAAHLVFIETLAPLALALIVAGALGGLPALVPMLAGALIAGGIFGALFALGHALYRVEALGFGDVQLAALFGGLLGWPGIVSALVLSMLLLLIATLALLAVRRIDRHSFVPIGLFLALGVLISALLVPPPWLR